MKVLALGFALCLTALGTAAHVDRVLKSTNGKVWTAEVRYPEFKGNSPLVRYANAAVKAKAQKIYDQFLRDVKAELKENPQADSYMLDVMLQVKLDAPTAIGVLVSNRSYWSGRAHDSFGFETMNFGLKKGAPARLALADLVKSPSATFAPVAKSLRKQGAEADMVKRYAPSLREMFVLTPKGLDFNFSPGTVAGGTQPYFVLLPWKSVPGLKPVSPLSAVVRRR